MPSYCIAHWIGSGTHKRKSDTSRKICNKRPEREEKKFEIKKKNEIHDMIIFIKLCIVGVTMASAFKLDIFIDFHVFNQIE